MNLQKHILRKHIWTIIPHALLALFLFGMGFFLLDVLKTSEWYTDVAPNQGETKMPEWVVWVLALTFIILGFREIFRMFKDFTLKEIRTELNPIENIELLKANIKEVQLFSNMKSVKEIALNENITELIFTSERRYDSQQIIHVFVDDKVISIYGYNVRIIGYFTGVKSEKMINQLRWKIQSSLS